MAYTNWIKLGSFIDGDITIALSKGGVLSNSITFLLDIYSSKYDKIDIAFEYKLKENENWRNDAIITSSTSTYAINNNLFGLSASTYGSQNTFKWSYDKNLALFGNLVQVRITILPRTINFSESNVNSILTNIVSQTYENNKTDVDVISDKRVMNKDKEGRYICFENNYVNVYSDITNVSPDFSVSYVYNPKYATQRENGRYLIADQGSGTPYYSAIIDTESIMSVSNKSLYITTSTEPIVFIDISEESNTILICKEGVGVSELIWDDAIISTNTVWQSNTLIISNPVCATYGKHNNIVICDKDKNAVFVYNRNSGEYKEINRYKQVSNSTAEENSMIYSPFRAYELDNGNIWICEKDGKVIDF